ncbi:homing endonuclease [Endogone sp. FLAS-F59071]|nr:homing endonuclease [Endogone sp. FLAS-F59071]|eukprot:RUS23417.1 homing endonuclease [Endogone sp. FLAS-F59071]
MAYSMNEVTNRTIEQEKALFDSLGIPYMHVHACPVKPELTHPPLIPAFIAGLIDGDGSFCISFMAGGRLKPGFHLTQHSALRDLLDKVMAYFGCGTIQDKESGVIRYQIDKFEDILNVLIPFMNSNMLHTDKAIHFQIFKEVCILIRNNPKPSKEDLLKIIDLAYNMNKDGKRRAMTKEEYIAKYITKQ